VKVCDTVIDFIEKSVYASAASFKGDPSQQLGVDFTQSLLLRR
jgi:hypothetical protein